jgi:hypothetical protein
MSILLAVAAGLATILLELVVLVEAVAEGLAGIKLAFLGPQILVVAAADHLAMVAQLQRAVRVLMV